MPAPRRTRADGERTREAIVRAAVSLATVDGLEGLSIGNLAAALDMSKSGVYAHFDSKQDLQLATVQEAERIFDAEVIEPALAAAPGLAQLVALCDAYFDHLLRRTFPGGCFFAGAALEMGTRPGPVKERIAAFQGRLAGLVRQLVVAAIERGELPSDEDPEALTFELNGLILAANTSFVLRQDEAALTWPATSSAAGSACAAPAPSPGRAADGARRGDVRLEEVVGRRARLAQHDRGTETPSICSRMMSAWPAWRASSSTWWTR